MAKYDRLGEHLSGLSRDTSHTLSFDRIEAIVGFALPKSARAYQAWWANQVGGGHVQANAWLDQGWHTAELSLGPPSGDLHARRDASRTEGPAGIDAAGTFDRRSEARDCAAISRPSRASRNRGSHVGRSRAQPASYSSNSPARARRPFATAARHWSSPSPSSACALPCSIVADPWPYLLSCGASRLRHLAQISAVLQHPFCGPN